MRGALFVDTSGWIAFFSRDDRSHAAVREAVSSAPRLVTSNFVFDEVITLVNRRAGFAAAREVGRTLRAGGVVQLVRAETDDEEAAWKIFEKRGAAGLSFTDCVSFAMMRRLGLRVAIALDDDFRKEGFETLP